MTQTQTFFSHQLDNGLTLIAESMGGLESAAFAFVLPAGCINDPTGQLGLANLACEMAQRGCGDRDSRQYVEALERLGVDRHASVATWYTSFGAAMLADNLGKTLEVYADLVRRPLLPEGQLEDGKQVCYQELGAIEDELAHRAMLRLKQRHYGDPWGRFPQGDAAHVNSIQMQDIQKFVGSHYRPNGAVLSVAGKIDWPALKDQVESAFGDWTPADSDPCESIHGVRGYEHIHHDSAQTHIGIAFDSVPYGHDDYFQIRGAVGVLSDGMSSRLFTELRENHGLCYTVSASCHTLPNQGSVVSYCGTSTERAQESMDLLLAELRKIEQGVEQTELDRLKARIKTNLVMQQESSSARASSIASDWLYLGRIMSMDEVKSIIDGLTCDTINRYLASKPPANFTVVTLGEQQLEVTL